MAATINLLPKNLGGNTQKLTRTALFQRISIFLLGLTLISLAGTVGARMVQRNELENARRDISLYQSQIEGQQDKNTQVLALKSQLELIQGLVGTDQKRKATFALVAFLAGPEITVSEVTIGKDGNTVITASSGSLLAINQLIKMAIP
jgi:hypothetical protein